MSMVVVEHFMIVIAATTKKKRFPRAIVHHGLRTPARRFRPLGDTTGYRIAHYLCKPRA